MSKNEQEIKLGSLCIEVQELRQALEEAQVEVARLRNENADLALALSAVRRDLVQQVENGAIAEWAAKLLTAYADKGATRQFSDKYWKAYNCFWCLIKNPPLVVRERVDPERVYFLEDGE